MNSWSTRVRKTDRAGTVAKTIMRSKNTTMLVIASTSSLPETITEAKINRKVTTNSVKIKNKACLNNDQTLF